MFGPILLLIFITLTWILLSILFKRFTESLIVSIGGAFVVSIIVVPLLGFQLVKTFQAYKEDKLVEVSNFPDYLTLRKAEKLNIYDYSKYQKHLKELEETRAKIATEQQHQKAMQELKKQWKKLDEKAKCSKDAKCTGRDHYPQAAILCQRVIEYRAKYDFKWTDGWGLKFPIMYWLAADHKIVIYAGDRIKLQNGFGAMQNYIYRCAYNIESEKVVDLLLSPGKY
jgi:hypothetical protein